MSNSLFSSEADDDERRGSGAGDKAVTKIVVFVLCLPLIPATLFGLFFYWLFLRILKFKRSVSGFIALLMALGSYLTFTGMGGFPGAVEVFTSDGGFLENWMSLVYLLIPLSVGIGALFGYGLILWDVRDIHNNPHRVELPGFWTYNIRWKKTPLELLRKRRAIKALQRGSLIDDQRAPLGYEEDADRVAYRFSEESVRHTLVTGAAGSGKTISMLSMMRADIESGRTVIAVDFKRSPEFAAKLAAWGNEFGVPFYHFEKGKPESYRIEHSLGQSTYDPFASGSGSEMVLNMREYDTNSAVYKEAMQQLLQVVFAMMEQADRSKAPRVDWSHGGIYQLASAITDPNLKDLLVAVEGQPIFHQAQDYVPLATASKGPERDALEKLRGQMRTIVASAYGRWFKIGDGSRNIDLLRMMTGDQTIVLFSFNSEDEPELSRYVGSMIFADMRACSSEIRSRKASKITNVYVDEFQAVPPTAVNGLLEKARESKIAMTLAQQAFEQIITSSPANGEAYLQSILVTCSNFLTHAGMTQDSAERISKLLGKHWKTVYSRTNKSDGGFLKNNFGNRRNQIVSANKQEVWKVEPAEFMALSAPSSGNGYKSTAILVNKAVSDPGVETEGTLARKLWMIPPATVLEEYVPPYIGDEVDPNAQKLYVDHQVSLVTEEEAALQKSYQDNTPVYREDSELIYGPGRGSNVLQEELADPLFPEEEAFEDFGSSYDDDDENDGNFEIEAIEDPESRQSLDHDLAAFDSTAPVRKVERKISPARRVTEQRGEVQPQEASRRQQPSQAPQIQQRRSEPPRAQAASQGASRVLEAQRARPAVAPMKADEDFPLPRLGRSTPRTPQAEKHYEEESLPDI